MRIWNKIYRNWKLKSGIKLQILFWSNSKYLIIWKQISNSEIIKIFCIIMSKKLINLQRLHIIKNNHVKIENECIKINRCQNLIHWSQKVHYLSSNYEKLTFVLLD